MDSQFPYSYHLKRKVPFGHSVFEKERKTIQLQSINIILHRFWDRKKNSFLHMKNNLYPVPVFVPLEILFFKLCVRMKNNVLNDAYNETVISKQIKHISFYP